MTTTWKFWIAISLSTALGADAGWLAFVLRGAWLIVAVFFLVRLYRKMFGTAQGEDHARD